MKKQITIILGIILALPLVFAMYGGESEVIEFSFETDNCTIIPNVTEGINFTFSSNQVLVEPAINFVGSFNITCYDWVTKETKTKKYGGGGYYTYPWRKVNQTSNETIDNEEVEEEIEPDESEEVIVEEPKSWLLKLLGAGVCVVLIIGLLWYFLGNKPEVVE